MNEPDGPSLASVLFVEDDDAVRHACVEWLSRVGFECLGAASGELALAALAERGGPVDVAVLDLRLPGIDGVALFREIARTAPGTIVVLSTGSDEDDARRRLAGDPPAALIAKPYRLPQLRDLILALLGRKAPAR